MEIIKQGIVHRKTEGPCRYQAWPTICKDENGVLYTVWSGDRSSHVCPFGKNLMSVSRDGGESWCPPIIVNDTWLDDRDGGITYLGDGKMLISYFHHPKDIYRTDWKSWILDGADGGDPMFRNMLTGYLDAYVHFSPEKDSYGSFLKRSEDYGVSWSEPIRVPISAPHGPVKTASGRLLYLGKEFNATMHRYNEKMAAGEDPIPEEDRGQIFLYESFDDGKTWEKLSKLPLPEGTTTDNIHEPHILELSDGELIAALRAQGAPVYRGFSMYFLNSADGGRSWSAPRSCEISGSPPHLMLASDGSVVVTYGRREEPFGIRAVVSKDGCRTFGEEMILSQTWVGDLGYPATVELSDGSFISVYYQRYENDDRTSILYTKWRID